MNMKIKRNRAEPEGIFYIYGQSQEESKMGGGNDDEG